MTRNLVNRVRKLEQEKYIISTDPRDMTDEDLIRAIKDGLDEEFHAGKLKDIEHKIKGYEAVGKTFYDLSNEEPEWFDKCMERIIEQFETKEKNEDV